MLYIVSAIERRTGKRVDLVSVSAPTAHDAGLSGVKLLDAEWRKKIELVTLEARPSADNP